MWMKITHHNPSVIDKVDQMSISHMEINKIIPRNNITALGVTMALEMETWQIPTQVEIKPDTTITIKTSLETQEIQEITLAITLLEIPHTIEIAIQVDGDFDRL